MFLILDFTQSFRIATYNNDQFCTKELKTKKNISEILIFEIDKFLKKSKTNIKKIKSICVVTGPGSFTGIRSALTYAKLLKLTKRLNILGLSKFEIINFKMQLNTFNKNRRIFLHFKDNQFFTQTFKGCKALDEARLYNFENEEFRYNKQISYIYDNIIFEEFVGNNIRGNIKNNLHLIDYNLNELQGIILKNAIDNSYPKPLYISNYY
tara:strand:- start:51 stop:677 length:627 start_codon:yes stop_codon:yes gene_type:complete